MVNAGVKGVGSSMACDDQLIDALLGGSFNTLRQDLLDCICRVVIPFSVCVREGPLFVPNSMTCSYIRSM